MRDLDSVVTQTELKHRATYVTENGGEATCDVYLMEYSTGTASVYVTNLESNGDAGALRGVLRQALAAADDLVSKGAVGIYAAVEDMRLVGLYKRVGFVPKTVLMKKG